MEWPVNLILPSLGQQLGSKLKDRLRRSHPAGADICRESRVLNCYELAPAGSAESTTISDRVLLTIAFSSTCSSAGTLNLSSVRWKSSRNASHSVLVIFNCACESTIDLPVYFCGPPVAQQTISVTRYLNPAGGTRWCASSTRGLALSLGSTMIRSMKSSTTVAML